MGGSVVGRRVAYYVTVVAGGILVHQQAFVDAAGESVAGFLRRNSEAYALMVLIPLFWDVFGWAANPDAPAPLAPRPKGWWHRPSLVAWTGALVVATIVTQSGVAAQIGLAPSVITLGEAFLAAAVIAAYLAWSRAIGVAWQPASGAPLEPWPTRLWFYAIAAASVGLAASQMGAVAGTGLGEWIARNAEAVGAIALLPLYFDVVATPESTGGKRLGWYAALISVPLVVAGGWAGDPAPPALVDLIGRATEAFLAAIVVSLYFDVWRGRAEHGQEHSGGEVADGRFEKAVEPTDL